MAEPIEANYVPDGDDWTITVSGRGKQLTGNAPGIIAARDRTDQLVEELAPDEEYRTVVHLLNGDAVQFTTAYLTARMAKSEPPPPAPEPVADDKTPVRQNPNPTADEVKPRPSEAEVPGEVASSS